MTRLKPIILTVLMSSWSVLPVQEIVVDINDRGHDVDSSLYGVFFEEINHAGDGG